MFLFLACDCQKPPNQAEQFGVIVDCSNRQLQKIPYLSVFTLELDLSFNNLTDIPIKAFSQYHFLKKLNLKANRLEFIDEFSFEGLNQIQVLDVSDNKINDVTSRAFQSNPNLLSINLSGNLLQKFDEKYSTFYFVKRLKYLDISKNKLKSLPQSEFHNLSKLRKLDVSNNQLSSLDGRVFSDMLSLKTLNLSRNQISRISNEAFLGTQTSLETLILDNNKLEKIPQVFNGLRELTLLDLRDNYLSALEDNTITSLYKLTTM